MSRHVLAVLAVGVAALGLAGAVRANVVTNGDFETGNASGWTIVKGNWMQEAGVGYVGHGLNSLCFWCRAGTGQYGWDDPKVYLKQNLWLIGGTEYNFSADVAASSGSNNGDGGTVAASLSGYGPLASHSFGTIGASEWKFATLEAQFTVPATGTYELVCTASRRAGIGPGNTPADYLDNIMITIIPEPASLSLLGLGGLGLLLRRKHP